ncbi:hypothetical protein G7046_g3939 [Stylonectria norvegica]|nr:hypothetical protein G7046_g3939 [Stylonectria norvegica]
MTSPSQSTAPTFESIGIRNTAINTSPNITLTYTQKVLVGSILDLFEGRPSLSHLSLWSPTATFQDPLTLATGYDRFAAQWYGLAALFSPIAIQTHEVTSAGDPIELTLQNKYVVKGIKKEQVMDSVVRIHVGADGRIDRVEDRWNDSLPQGAVAQVSATPGATDHVFGKSWARMSVGVRDGPRWADAFRKLNAVTVPAFVKVPKTPEEDEKMRADRVKAEKDD